MVFSEYMPSSGTIQYYSAIEKKEILPFATTWMDLEGIMLTETSKTKKDKCHINSPIWNLKANNQTNNSNNKINSGTEHRLVVARGWGLQEGEMGEDGQSVQTSSYKINQSWEYNIQNGDYS